MIDKCKIKPQYWNECPKPVLEFFLNSILRHTGEERDELIKLILEDKSYNIPHRILFYLNLEWNRLTDEDYVKLMHNIRSIY